MSNILEHTSSAAHQATPVSAAHAPSLPSDTSPKSTNSTEEEPLVLTPEEVEALRLYSASVKNFTYRLFENFKDELERREKGRSASPPPPRKYPRRTSPPMQFPEGTGL
ncbi:uncharacterized protein MELLADRAFT_101775 [Melampsora larici-populina 98AG31]|uniref:Uncharacterized protein n=1 Tax=Melampsora larici-populina (strain 98AG31 / pathotype 3-4-7) TaxID=747676 RepID=F4R6X6_MELLP|nr:uncharacterized protein MELLADRAFT_101775 [Melampsora larici-populina 98AG31]EGG11947.1 hypothetical protein MELLADRAFT_101775 [Melampsora larici-populina 98AG31]